MLAKHFLKGHTVLPFINTCKYAGFATQVEKSTEVIGEIVLEKLHGSDRGIAIFGLNRPKAKNAFGYDLIHSIREGTKKLKTDKTLSVVIVRSFVPGVFCSGADLKERAQMSDEDVKIFVHGLRATLTDIEDLPMPTIAAVDGFAVGGGLELALACDLRTASDNAKLGLVETSRGLIPGAGGTQRLPRSISVPIAKELIYTSRILNGNEAKKIELVNHVVPQNKNGDAAFQRALELAREISINAPIALRLAKRAINEGIQVSLKEGYDIEQNCYEINIPTQDRREGMLSFKEKRKPVFKGE